MPLWMAQQRRRIEGVRVSCLPPTCSVRWELQSCQEKMLKLLA
jgi:hypothetical protein